LHESRSGSAVAARPPRSPATPSEPAGRSTAWMSRGACQGEDPELFFPIASTGPFRVQIDAAKGICRRCPELTPCLTYAIRTAQDGIWGGTTREERRAMPSHQWLPAPALHVRSLAAAHADAGLPPATAITATAH
jgi:WhiB family transcriptional regulator, redox-sensing transcriptional regulator